MASPFWSEEQQRLFLEQQNQEVERPADLERYEATARTTEQLEISEREQNLEPPYETPGTTMQVDQETRQLISDGSQGSGNTHRGRTEGQSSPTPQLARMEARVDVSPGRRSAGYESLQSHRSGGSKEEAGLFRSEVDDQELMPDYSRLMPGINPAPLQTTEAGEAEPGRTGDHVGMLMAQMSSVMSRMLQDQLGPTLNQMMLHQARVESRLEILEATASRPMSVTGEATGDRALLDGSEVARPSTLRATESHGQERPVQEGVHSSSSELQQVEVEDLSARFAEMNRLKAGPKPESTPLQTGRSQLSPEIQSGEQPTQGEIMIGGVRHAWSIGAAGLQLSPIENSPSPKRQELSAGDVLAGRAQSPFERYKGDQGSPKSEPRVGLRARGAVARELRPSTSDPISSRQTGVENGIQELGWVQRGRLELEQLLASPKGISGPAPPPPPRSVTPVRPRIVYPFSPGGTEIKPPPQPQRSPKRNARTSPSPSRNPPTIPAAPQESSSQEPMSEMKQLAALLGEAIKSSKGGDNRVEDVKTIPELPKLEIKENERDLSPLIAGDWVTVIGPSLRDLSSNATQWWDEVVGVAKQFYDRWLLVGPMERLVMVPDRPQRFNTGPFTRVEQRAISLLLKAVPTHIRDDLVSSRKLTSIEALCAILTTYQPGGLRERSALLKYLTSPEPGKSITETLRGLRRWGRWRLRAHELGIGIPDATLLVGGLDTLTSTILQQYPDVLFRINTFRHMNNLDHVPTEVSAASLAQFLQAEFQALDSGGGAKRVKLAKAQEQQEREGEGKGKEGKGKQKSGKGKSSDGNNNNGNGAKGKGCYHWMTPGGCRLGTDCRFRHDREALNSSSDVSNRCYVCSGLGHRSLECNAPNNYGSDQGTASSGNGGKAKGGKTASKGEGKGNGVVKKVEEDKPNPNTAQLISAAGQLLDQMQIKALLEVPQINRVAIEGARTGLIDSGASNCLRQAIGEEAKHLLRRTVDLAQGTAELFVTPCGTLVSEEPVETIVALGLLIKMGCRLQWEERGCVLWHPQKGRVVVDTSTGCPRISEALALEFITEIESQRMQSVGAAIKAMQAQQTQELPSQKQAIANLVSSIERDIEVGSRIGEAALALWPQIPRTLLGELTVWPQGDNKALPINRRKRRAVDKATRATLHLFAGDSRKEIEKKGAEKGFEVLSIGEQEDIMAGQTFKYLLGQAAAGRWDAIWAAPPCGTNTLCRFIQPGPPPLRGREGESRWGLPGLSAVDRKKVQMSDEMYLRCLLIMLVAAEGRKRHGKSPTWSLAENPQDPDEYLEVDAQLRIKAQETGGLPSWFATEEFRTAAKLLGMEVHRGDQGPYGHPRRKPTGWASTKPLPQLLRGPGTGCDKADGVSVTQQKSTNNSWESKTWAKWASGMIDVLMEQLVEVGGSEAKRVEINWTEHIASGHWPPLRQCRTCIMANARHRAHKRIAHPSSWTLSLDTVGPFKAAVDETERNLRFALVGCLVVPVDQKGRPVLGPAQEQASEESTIVEQPGNQEGDDDNIDLAEALGIKALDSGDSDQEPVIGADETEKAHQQCEQDGQGMSQEELECRAPGLRWKEVHFIEILKRKTPQSIVLGTSRILSEIRELGLPVVRCHTDSGTEYINSRFRDFVAKHDMKHTCASPQEPSSNGRVESAIGRIKSLAKVHLNGAEGGPDLWPLALRAAVASMKSQSLKSMGFPIPKVIPFGTKVQVLARTWLRRRKQEWHLKARGATVLCPAALVKLGYVVQVGKQLAVVTKLFHGDEPTLEVSAEGGPEGNNNKAGYKVTLNQEGEPPVAHSTAPEARVTGKQNRPDMSIRPGPKSRYKTKAPAPGVIPKVGKMHTEQQETDEDELAAELAHQSPFDVESAIQFIMNSSYVQGTSGADASQSKRAGAGKQYIFGAFRHGGVVGLTNNCKVRPGMAKLLACIAKAKAPQAEFTTTALSVNGCSFPHRDTSNLAASKSYWIPIAMPNKGGRIWTELKKGQSVVGEPMTLQVKGKSVIGQFHDPNRVAVFDPTAWHGTEQWSPGQPRVAILMYTTGCLYNLNPYHRDYLQDLGFAVTMSDKGGDLKGNKNEKEVDEDMSSCGVQPVGSGEGSVNCDQGCVPFRDLQKGVGSGGVQPVGSGEGSVNCDQGCVPFRDLQKGVGSGGVQPEGSGEDLSMGSSKTWCSLCEEWIVPDNRLECKACGCNMQFSLPEQDQKTCQNQINNKKPQKPNKNGITQSYKNFQVKAVRTFQDPEAFELPFGQSVDGRLEWIAGVELAARGNAVPAGSEGLAGNQMLMCDEVEGQDWSQVDESGRGPEEAIGDGCVLDRFVVDVEVGSMVGHGDLQEAVEEHELPRGCVEEHELPRGCVEELPRGCVEEHGLPRGCVGESSEGLGSGDEGSSDLDELNEHDCGQGYYDSPAEVRRAEMALEGMHENLRRVDDLNADQLDIDQFAAWLDESQLRISEMCDEAIGDWIEGKVPEGAQEAEQRKLLDQHWQDMEDLRMELRILCVKRVAEDMMELEGEASGKVPEILQTRIVANHEVARSWDIWQPSAAAEIAELVENKQALERSNTSYLQELRARGVIVKAVPSKVIFSVKAPKGKFKARLVACGNFLDQGGESRTSHRDAVFTESVSIEGLRTALAFSVRRSHVLITVDVRAAFLNAPQLPRDRRRAEELAGSGESITAESTGEVIALVPPRMLVNQGMFTYQTRLLVRRAVYGLDTSPRDWALKRDSDLRGLIVWCGNTKYALFQSSSEPGIWLISSGVPKRGFEATCCRNLEGPEIAGWAAIYVDDIMISAEATLAEAVVRAVQTLWSCSDPETVGRERPGVRFLGLDLFWINESTLALSQESYLLELGRKHQSELQDIGQPATPMIPGFDDEAVEPDIKLEDLRRTQGLVGEILWAAIRTRPDASYAVSRIASRTSKAPRMAYKAALHTLAYLLNSASWVLTYSREPISREPEPCKHVEYKGLIQGFGDASFAPEAQRSMQSLQVFIEGNLVAWSVGRQPFMTQSSCESELIALLDLGSYTLSMGYLLDELLQRKADKEIRGDNTAALSIYAGTSSHWRTRHLKIRARMFHERNQEGDLPASHIAGEVNPADIGTKALAAPRHWRLVELLGLTVAQMSVKAVSTTKTVGVTLRDCLLAVVLACCLRTADAQPTEQDRTGEWALWIIVILIVISAIGVWEFCRGLVQGGRRGCCCRPLRVPQSNNPQPESDPEDFDEPQPIHEDELVEDMTPPPRPPAENFEEAPIPTPPPPPEPQLRQRRGLPVYRPEPDDEPGPIQAEIPQQAPDPRPQPEQFQGVVLGRYVDDIVLGIPEAVLGNREQVNVQGFAQPPRPAEGQHHADQPRVRIRDFEEVRQQVRREEAERRILDLPVQPQLIVNPVWGPSPTQPTLREVRNSSSPWGGPESAVFHAPPVMYRGDFYQIDLRRGVLIRWHCKGRTKLFTPIGTRLPQPMELRVLTGDRRTVVHELTRRYFLDDTYHAARATRALQAEWRGRTELRINLGLLRQLQQNAPNVE